MNAAADPRPDRRRRRRLALGFGGLALLLLILALALRVALRPEHVTALLLARAGEALGLQIVAEGIGEYRLGAAPRLVVRGLLAREPGGEAILRAGRIAIAVPWSTIRSRGALLEARRVEIDEAVLDLPALQAWLAKRPPGETRIPTLTEGLHIRRSRIDAGDWAIEGLSLALPHLSPERPVAGHLRGRYLGAPLSIGFDLQAALSRPASRAGLGLAGGIAVSGGGWRVPARLRLSGPLRLADGVVEVAPMRVATVARYEAGDTRLPFALGVNAGLRFADGRLRLAPAFVAVRGEGAMPTLDAQGAMALGATLDLAMKGRLTDWNDAWPALPPPLGQSDSPLPFRIDYVGKRDGSDVARLRLRRDEARFDGRFRLPALLDWIAAKPGRSPLPPLDGRATAPRMEVSGASLEGVEIEIDDPSIESETDAAGSAP